MLPGCTPWPPELAERYRHLGYWRGQTLGELVDTWAEELGDRVAIVAGPERITYRQFAGRVDRLARHLLRLGLRPPERVVVQLPNVPELVYLYYACTKIGLIPVMALPAHRHSEIAYLAELADAAAYAVPAGARGFDYQDLARQVCRTVPSVRRILVTGDDVEDDLVSLTELLANPIEATEGPERPATPRPNPEDVALFLLSGGTTGLPKLIPRTHDDYAYNSRASAEVSGFSRDTVYLVSLPASHNFPLACPGMQGTFMHGGQVVLLDDPEPTAAFALIERERVTATSLVPALALRWMDAPERERFDLSSLQVLQVGGARLNPEAARRVGPTLGCRLQQVFGMAEGLLNYTRLDDPDEVVVGTQGRPASPDDEVRIVDEHDVDVRPGEPGHLLTRGPYTVRGYYRAPEHNRRAFTDDGFYRTGDIVRADRIGNLSVEGRDKDMINRGGEKISAEEVENLVLAHPAVFNVAVVAMPDPVLGERSCAYVIPKPGATLTFEDLVHFLQQRQIARFKLPERLELVDRFPLTNVGKVSKKDLREDIIARLRAEGAI